MHVITCICKMQPRCPRDHIVNCMNCNNVKTCACLIQGNIFGGIIEIYHACKWYLPKNTGWETKQISLAYRIGKFVQSLNQYFLANITYKYGIFLYNYTLYKNVGFWLVNSRDIFLQIQALHCDFLLHVGVFA